MSRRVGLSIAAVVLLLAGETGAALTTYGAADVNGRNAHAYYETASFRGGVAIVTLALVWAMYQLRLRQIARTLDVRFDERISERMRIARELHDTLLQSFQGLMLRFQSARDLLPVDPAAAAAALDGALDRADQAIVEGRDAIGSLRSSRASDSELAQAIAALAEDFQRANAGRAPAFRATVEGTPRALHPVLREDVYRIACEALRNAYHHAHASRIEAEITYGVRDLRVRIRDDGRGIDPEYLKAPPARHWGLISMRERASQIGSDLRVWSGEGIGTEVELRIPGAIAYSGRGRPDLLRRLLGKGRHDAA